MENKPLWLRATTGTLEETKPAQTGKRKKTTTKRIKKIFFLNNKKNRRERGREGLCKKAVGNVRVGIGTKR